MDIGLIIVKAERPNTTEELYELLKNFKENDANQNGVDDEIPLTASSIAELRYNLLPAFGINQTNGILEKNNEVKYAFIQDEYKAYLEYLKRLYDEKLLDHASFLSYLGAICSKRSREQGWRFPNLADCNGRFC